MKEKSRIEDLNIFKLVSENPNDAYFLLDRNARFLYVNNTACRMFGYTRK